MKRYNLQTRAGMIGGRDESIKLGMKLRCGESEKVIHRA